MADAIALPELAHVPAVAAYLGMSVTKCWQMVWAGELPSVKIGVRSTRIPRAALEAWLAANTVGAA